MTRNGPCVSTKMLSHMAPYCIRKTMKGGGSATPGSFFVRINPHTSAPLYDSRRHLETGRPVAIPTERRDKLVYHIPHQPEKQHVQQRKQWHAVPNALAYDQRDDQ